MTRKINLTVNDVPIYMGYFVASYVDHVVGGIIRSLHGTGEITALEINVDDQGQVKINLNDADVSLKEFPVNFIRSTLFGMVAPLKGVEGEINRVKMNINHIYSGKSSK